VNPKEGNYKGKSTSLDLPDAILNLKDYHPLIEVRVKPKTPST
jgi:hypothetical protein